MEFEDLSRAERIQGQNARLSNRLKWHNPKNGPRPDLQTTSSFDRGSFTHAVPPHPQSLLLASLGWRANVHDGSKEPASVITLILTSTY